MNQLKTNPKLTSKKRERTSKYRTRKVYGGRPMSRRYFTKDMGTVIKSSLSMEAYWEDIESKLKGINNLTCVMCKTELPKTFRYQTVMSISSTQETTDKELIVRKYNLPSALRNFRNVMGSDSNAGGTLFQPTIFYFHCPNCGFMHQFKSSVVKNDTN